MNEKLTGLRLEQALKLLDGRLALGDAPHVGIVICGGAAMIVTGLLSRTTTDVDIVALMDDAQDLVAPAPLPDFLLKAAREVTITMQLPGDWLNNGPSRDEGGLFQMGLPEGFKDRLHPRRYGEHLTAHFIDRVDQIHFKLYAAVDRGGYHVSDLDALQPTEEELTQAARWALTHDVSEEFRVLMKRFLGEFGHENAASAI